MVQPVPLAVRYSSVEELIDSMRRREQDELFVPCALKGVLELPVGTPVFLSVRFADDPGRIFLVNGHLTASERVLRPGIRFAFAPDDVEGKSRLLGYVVGREARLVERRAPRLLARMSVSCWAPDRRIDAYTEDVSMGGALVRPEAPLPAGTPIELHLRLPLSKPIDVRGRVVHHQRRPERMGMGVAFEGSTDAQRRLARLVESLWAQA